MRQIGSKAHEVRKVAERAALLAALWTLIAVTLLSALAPIGPPLSRAKGSAFNPATSDVVLKGRAPAAAQMTQAVEPRTDGVPPQMAVLAVLPLLGWIGSCAGHIDLPGDRLGRLAVAGIRRARAPPTAF